VTGGELDIVEQVARLGRCVEARVEAVPDEAAPGRDAQERLDAVIAGLERATRTALLCGRGHPEPLADEARWPGVGSWASVRPLSLALHPAYAAGSGPETLGAGLRADDLDVPLIGPDSAIDLVRRATGPATADLVRRQLRSFLETPVGPELRLLLSGCLDARALRTRAGLAARLVVRHVACQAPPGTSLVVASLGCGPGGSALRLADALRVARRPPSRLYLVDHDPVALCVARRVLDDADAATEVLVRLGAHAPYTRVRTRVPSRVPARPARAPGLWGLGRERVDVIEVPSLVHYLPTRAAVEMLIRLRDVVAPHGVVVVGSMLRPRPQQVFFRHVLRWPTLRQRTLAELVDLVALAGWPIARAEFVVPAGEPVYAVGVLRP
jgi:hypothetical protein